MGPFDDILGTERKTPNDVAVAFAHGNVLASANGERVYGLFGGLMWDANSLEAGGSGQSHWIEGSPCERTGAGSFVSATPDAALEFLADVWADGGLEEIPGSEYRFASPEGSVSRFDGMTWDEVSEAEHEEAGDVFAAYGPGDLVVIEGIAPEAVHPCEGFGMRVEVPFDNGDGSADLWVPDQCVEMDDWDDPSEAIVVMQVDVPYTVDLNVFPQDAGRYDRYDTGRLGPAEHTPAHRLAMTGADVAEHVGHGGGQVARSKTRPDAWDGQPEHYIDGIAMPEPDVPVHETTWDAPVVLPDAEPGEPLRDGGQGVPPEVPPIEPDWFPYWPDAPEEDPGFEMEM